MQVDTVIQHPATLEPLQSLVKTSMTQVDQVIIDSVQQHVPLITDITRHIVSSGGKRLRPALTAACGALLSYDGTRHIPLAACVELIHTATLLHDDVVDESTLRRGMETANAVWSNQASILVGDYLLSRAFQLMVADGSLAVLRILSDASATISQGEVSQLMAAGDVETSADTYLHIITAKTATLFSAACEIVPAIMERDMLRPQLHAFGTHLGIAFQLIDDVLDYSAAQEALGKAVGDDLREGKLTLPVIDAYRKGTHTQQAFWQRVIADGDYRDGDLTEAQQYMNSHGSLDRTVTLARNHAQKAAEYLHRIDGDAQATDALLSCLAFCVERAY